MEIPLSNQWHSLKLETVLDQLQTSPNGLTKLTAKRRLERYGANCLPQFLPANPWQIVFRQFRSPLIFILGLAVAISIIIGDVEDAGFILAVLMINALIGGYQEWRAEKSSRALQRLLKINAVVMRDGEIYEIDSETIIPGDIVWLESGNRVPADLRLVRTHNLVMDESLLTGESFSVLKQSEWLGEVSTPLADRLNMAYAGSTVIQGRARGVVVATGSATTVGQLAHDVMSTAQGKPPLLERMERFSRMIGIAVVVAAVAIVLLGIFIQGYSWLEMVFFGIALAVSAIPEGLPVALTVALSVATHRMAQRNVIVRRLPAVEGLGSCTLIASDKTGTLTCNELTVCQIALPNGDIFEVTGEGFTPHGHVRFKGQIVPPDVLPLDRLARAAVLCNEADLHHRKDRWLWRGDPTDIALLTAAHKLGWHREPTLNLYPQVNEIPFEPEHQFAATYHLIEQQVHVLVKGAPERLMAMCTPESDISSPWAIAQHMAEQGYRVLALAEGIAPVDLTPTLAPPEPTNLTLLGFMGMIDPLRSGVIEAIANCHAAGIRVWMITGDHPATALAIARNLRLADERSQVVTGQDLEGRSPQAIQQIIQTSDVFARITPHQKLQLVNAARANRHFVAVTGDGVNDAPALRAANIGVAMGKAGTDVAREAAELVISDDNFATIVAGIEEGRIAYDNIRKVIYLLVSTGSAEIILLSLAVGFGLPLPLLPVQLLWLNLVTNGIQDVALAFEPGEGDVLKRKPRSSHEPIFNRVMIERTILGAIVMGVISFVTFDWLLKAGYSVFAARNILLLLMVLFEKIHIANCRSETKSAFKLSLFRSPILLVGTILAFLVHVLMMYLPLGNRLLSIEPVTAQTWCILILLSFTILIPIELHKVSRFQGLRNLFPNRRSV